MKSDSCTVQIDSQSPSAIPPQLTASSRRGTIPGSVRTGRAVAYRPMPPRLVGDREMLRKLRAAETAAWEAIPPSTTEQPELGRERKAKALDRDVIGERFEAGVWLLVFLAGFGTVALSLDLQDYSLLLTAWSQLVAGIRSLSA